MFDTLSAFINEQLQNDFFTGGIALAALGVAATLGSWAFPIVKTLFIRHFCVQLTVNTQQPVYHQLLTWLHTHEYTVNCRRLKVDQVAGGDATLMFTPALGNHLIRHDGVFIHVERSMSQSENNSASHRGEPRETVTLTAFTPRPFYLRNLLQDISHIRLNEPDTIQVHEFETYGDWACKHQISRRPLSSVIIPGQVGEHLINDARQYFDRQDWYRSRGVPWRRGYLLYGPPGTGKTSLVRALASELDLDLSIVNLSSKDLTDACIAYAMRSAPRKSILLLEDIDAAFNGRNDGDTTTGITFSGLLNAIDGVLAQEGHLLVMTTNHAEQLDPALVRPGRVDLSLEVGLAGPKEAERLFLMFFPGQISDAKVFAETFRKKPMSPAAIQAQLLTLGNDGVQ